MAERRLKDADRAFFSLVAEATFSNPFGERRASLDRRMARAYAAPGGGPDLVRVLGHLASRLGALDVRHSQKVERDLRAAVNELCPEFHA